MIQSRSHFSMLYTAYPRGSRLRPSSMHKWLKPTAVRLKRSSLQKALSDLTSTHARRSSSSVSTTRAREIKDRHGSLVVRTLHLQFVTNYIASLNGSRGNQKASLIHCFIGFAAMMSLDLGLHKSTGNYSLVDHERRVRVFWNIYVYEKSVALPFIESCFLNITFIITVEFLRPKWVGR